MPQRTRRPTTAPAPGGIPEHEELSPLGIPSFEHGFMGNAFDSRHRQNSVASTNSSLNPTYSNPAPSNPAYSNPTHSNSAYPNRASSIGFDPSPISPQRLQHPRSTSLSPSASVPHLSTSLPTPPGGSYFPPERAASHNGNFPSRSVQSSESSAHLTGPVREAVTDSRKIVNVNETGMVLSGTLEGLVERLIVNFSGCCRLSHLRAEPNIHV